MALHWADWGSLPTNYEETIARQRVMQSARDLLGTGLTEAAAFDAALAETIQASYDILTQPLINVKNPVYAGGAVGDGVADDTAPILAAYTAGITAYPGGFALYLPAGDYNMTEALVMTNACRLIGDGKDISRIIMTSVVDDRIGVQFTSGGASQVLNVAVIGIGIYSADTTHRKIGLDIVDATGGIFHDIYIYGAGTGTPSAPYFSGGTGGSIGIQTKGRDTCAFSDIQCFADRPIVIAANPNTAATDGEDADHFRFSNLYLVANGYPCVTVTTGLGLMECEWDGYQAWVGGTDGFLMNDTRVAPNVPSRGISIKNVRREQGQDAAAYGISITAVAHVQQLRIERTLIASGSHGILIDGVLHTTLANVTTAVASGKNALLMQGAIGGCVARLENCYWQGLSAVFTMTGYLPTTIEAWETGTSVGPQSATYAVTRNDTLVNVRQVVAGASTTALSSMNIPHGTAPTSPVNGDYWTTTLGEFVQRNGTTKTLLAGGDNISVGTIASGAVTGSSFVQGTEFRVGGTKVLGTQGALLADADDAESSVYTGIDNAQGATPYATVTDLNALRVAYEDLRADHNTLLARMRAHGVIAT